MSQPHILLAGVFGNTGRVIAQSLQARAIPFAALTHSARNQAELAARGITTVLGDFDDPASLSSALRGIERAYLVCTPDEKLVPRETAFIQAAKQAGVAHVVMCSAYLSGKTAETQKFLILNSDFPALAASATRGQGKQSPESLDPRCTLGIPRTSQNTCRTPSLIKCSQGTCPKRSILFPIHKAGAL